MGAAVNLVIGTGLFHCSNRLLLTDEEDPDSGLDIVAQSPCMRPQNILPLFDWEKTTLDSASMLMVFALGGIIVLVNPKNLPLVPSASVDYAQANLGTVQIALVVTEFVLMGALVIFLPIVLVHLARQSSAKLFDKMRPWLVAHNAAILAAVCTIVGAAMLGRALSAAL